MRKALSILIFIALGTSLLSARPKFEEKTTREFPVRTVNDSNRATLLRLFEKAKQEYVYISGEILSVNEAALKIAPAKSEHAKMEEDSYYSKSTGVMRLEKYMKEIRTQFNRDIDTAKGKLDSANEALKYALEEKENEGIVKKYTLHVFQRISPQKFLVHNGPREVICVETIDLFENATDTSILPPMAIERNGVYEYEAINGAHRTVANYMQTTKQTYAVSAAEREENDKRIESAKERVEAAKENLALTEKAEGKTIPNESGPMISEMPAKESDAKPGSVYLISRDSFIKHLKQGKSMTIQESLSEKCKECSGRGYTTSHGAGMSLDQIKSTCPSCRGKGSNMTNVEWLIKW